MSLIADVQVHHGEFTLAVELRVARGETLVVVGANGAGKTTLLRTIAGLLPIDAGRIVVDGMVVDDGDGINVAPEARSVGFVFQDQRLFPHISAAENAAFGLRARGVDGGEARARAQAELDAFGVGDCADQRPGDLSGGQAQRVALARTFVTAPRVLVLDEPFTAIDAGARPSVRAAAFARAAAMGCVTVLVTHDGADAPSPETPAIELVAGRVVRRGSIAALSPT